MTIKTHCIILAAAFGLMIAGSVAGSILEASGAVTRESLGTKGLLIIKLVYLGLFLLAAFAAIPLFIRFFIGMQIRIGNGELFLVKFFQSHEQALIYGFWGLYILGLAIAGVLAGKDILKNLG